MTITINNNIDWSNVNHDIVIDYARIINGQLNTLAEMVVRDLEISEAVEFRRFIGSIIGSIVSEVIIPIEEARRSS
ncbi:MAG: hypothetical protein Q8L66_13290 [Caulobacter sp.]|nr:hypothetical protein [Caulobacter sp.]